MRLRWWPIAATLVAPSACEPTRQLTARALDDRPPQAPVTCVVAVNDAEVPIEVSDESRLACVARARLIEDTIPRITDGALRAGPPSDHPFATTDVVYCRLIPRPKWSGSLKFRCMRTNAANVLYDEDGDLRPEAAAFDDDGHLLGTGGKKLRKKGGSPREGDELRVKYFVGSEPEPRQREMFTETVVSHLFWALGIPVDRVYMPASVRCFGCSADPFGQTEPLITSVPHVFRLASVERPYEGKKIAVTRRRSPFGLGAEYDHGFGFDELGPSGPGAEARRIEAEVLALALNIVGYNNTHSYQNDLLCRKGRWDKETGECAEIVAYVSDVGGTLGGARSFKVAGDPDPAMTLYPRGDFVTFAQGSVFNDRATCTLHYPVGPITQVTEPARSIMEERIRGRLDRERVRIIFETARIHRLERRLNALVAEEYELEPGPDLERAVQLLWADEIVSRLDEILSARCWASVPDPVLDNESPA
jgi:hypothetical protein